MWLDTVLSSSFGLTELIIIINFVFDSSLLCHRVWVCVFVRDSNAIAFLFEMILINEFYQQK